MASQSFTVKHIITIKKHLTLQDVTGTARDFPSSIWESVGRKLVSVGYSRSLNGNLIYSCL